MFVQTVCPAMSLPRTTVQASLLPLQGLLYLFGGADSGRFEVTGHRTVMRLERNLTWTNTSSMLSPLERSKFDGCDFQFQYEKALLQLNSMQPSGCQAE